MTPRDTAGIPADEHRGREGAARAGIECVEWNLFGCQGGFNGLALPPHLRPGESDNRDGNESKPDHVTS
jgi:hypothetical protein